MTLSLRTTLLASAAALALPAAANAASVFFDEDIAANSNYTFAQTVAPGNDLTFRFTALTDFKVNNIAIAGTGTNGGTDISSVLLSSNVDPLPEPFQVIESEGTVGTGTTLDPGFPVMMGDLVTLTVDGDYANEVGISVSFTTSDMDIPPVPLPAAGGLLALALAGTGVVASRKKKFA